MTSPARKPKVTKPVDEKALMTRISKAKTGLVLSYPFFGSIALNMEHSLSRAFPTAATNGKWCMYNPEFINELTDEELLFLVTHEVCHPMLEHPFRRNGRDPKKWNKAGDYVINQLLKDEGIGKMPDGGLQDKAVYDSGGGTTDGIYNVLQDEPDDEGDEPGDDDGKGKGKGNGTALDECLDAEGSPAEVAQQDAEWRIRVAQAAQAAKMQGKLSERLKTFIDQVLSPKVDWRNVLQRFMQRVKTNERTFARPNRRFIQQGLYLPSITGEMLGELVVFIDCSGSVGDEDVAQFSAELHVIKDDMKPKMLHVIYFTSEVTHHDKFGPNDDLTVARMGNGGTAFSPLFKYIDKEDIRPVACVVLTDLVCDDFGPAPDYPVLWVSTHADKAPFGEIVMIK
jgi:predicted metal-dependent peptidase